MRLVRVLACLTLGLGAVSAGAQSMQDAGNDGRAFGQAQGTANVGAADSEASAQANLPNYNGATAPQTTYMDNPASLDAARATVAASNPAYRLTVDGNLTRPQVSRDVIDAALARGNLINQSPDTYAQGIANGITGSCVPLPPSSATTGTFEATCNKGLARATGPKTCAITTDVAIQSTTSAVYDYYVALDNQYGAPFPRTATFAADLANGSCKIVPGAMGGCSASTAVGLPPNKFCGDYSVQHYQCSTDYTPAMPDSFVMPSTNKWWFAKSGAAANTATPSRNESLCASLVSDKNCSAPVETCTDSSPATRNFGGVDVTQSCWAWSRTYTCTGTVPANNCSGSTIPQGCTFTREECLDDPAPAVASQCKVFQEVYTCPITGQDPKSQYVCGGDVYCINGDCEPIVREASTEFKDALVGLHTLDQSAKEFNAIDYTLFKGAGQTCSKPVFGLGNCCGGHGFPLIGSCNAADHLLAAQIDKGLTHYVGTYCAHSFFVCTTTAQSYCVFSSKLTRILQEQGRPQIGKTWGSAKNPNCAGFTVAEFGQLDLSVMDFAEVYQDFIQAAKLPDEAATLTDIQAKIAAYYSRGHS